MHINFSRTRQAFIFVAFISLFIMLFTRLFYIQIAKHAFYSDLAGKQHKIFVKLEPRRGSIYDRQERMLAIYMEAPSLYAVPKEVADKEGTARILSRALDLDEETIVKRLKRDNYFAWIKRKIDRSLAGKIKGRRLKGVYLINEPKRFYPGQRLACHLLGIAGVDNEGLEGVELYYDRELKGEYGWRRAVRDAKKREITSSVADSLPARDGQNIVLTIDEVIQHILEKEIESIVKSHQAKAVSVIAMNPRTGEILGMAGYPWFNPNEISGINTDFLRNRAISDSFEPGSIFKVVTAAAALEEGAVDFDTEFFCENGTYKVGKRTLHDYRPYGRLKFREVIEKSSNIGTVKVAARLGNEKLAAYIKRFGFAAPTGIDLPGEASGIMRDTSKWSYVDMTTIPMGQGIAVTALQLASAISVIANGGILMRPYVVREFLSEGGMAIRRKKPAVVRKVISRKTADKVKELLRGVVERGTGRRAALDDFAACGKTGTAEKVKPTGGYYKDRYIASFIGFAPYDRPAVSLVICVDEPRGEHFGGQVAAPAFKNIMDKILSYMYVEKERV